MTPTPAPATSTVGGRATQLRRYRATGHPGATVSHDGLIFTWPGAAPGTADNVVASGQTIELSGSGKTLGILGSGDYGTATGSGTITYTDGTNQPFTLSLSDWYSNSPQPGGDVLDTFPYHNSQCG